MKTLEPSSAPRVHAATFEDPGTSRWLYDRVAQIQFSPPDSTFTPDEAGLQVLRLWGRWFDIWTDPKQPSEAMPVRLRFQAVRIEVSDEDPADIQLYAV
jgi:hypothetical protein